MPVAPAVPDRVGPPSDAAGWVVVLPVKRLAAAKSRLALDPRTREALALAMAQDVAAAAAAAGAAVLVVTDDPVAAAGVPARWVAADEPRAGLSAAVRHGATEARRHRPGAGIVVLAADLPALRAVDLAAVVASLDGHGPTATGVVADAAGVGTVLLAAGPRATVSPSYEGQSFAAHRAAGAVDLTPRAGARLRRDVDTVADLRAARLLGTGPATAAVLATLDGSAAW